jgi:hypothetical protein
VIRSLNSDRWFGGDFEIIASGKRSIPPRRTMPDAPNPSSETIDKNEHCATRSRYEYLNPIVLREFTLEQEVP